MRMMKTHDGNIVNGMIKRSSHPTKPTELWVYRGAADWDVYRLVAYNATTETVTLGSMLRQEHHLA